MIVSVGYFDHRIKTSTSFVHQHRNVMFDHYLRDQSVLHVGFVDYPVTNPQQNLHVRLASICRELEGYDLNTVGAQVIREHLPADKSSMYHNLSDVPSKTYDWVIIPDVIEHVDNVRAFLEEMDHVSFHRVMITAPHAFTDRGRQHGEIYHEKVHPDHNCWYSPYTLSNVVRKFTKWRLDEVFVFNNNDSVCVIASK